MLIKNINEINLLFNNDDIEYIKNINIINSNLKYTNKEIYDKIIKLVNDFNFTFPEVVYILKNNINEIPLCECGAQLSFISKNIGYRKFCSSKCSNNSNITKDIKKKNVLNRYGVDNVSKLENVKEKISSKIKETSKEALIKRQKTNIEKYGHTTNLYNNDIIEKRNVSLRSLESIEKRKNTLIEKYGSEYLMDNIGVYNKRKNTCIEKWDDEIPQRSIKYKLLMNKSLIDKLNSKHDDLYIHSLINRQYNIDCNICNTNFTIDINSFNIRKNRNLEICTNCLPINKNKSLAEDEIYNYIRSIYDGEIISNYRIKNKEIDIYLPSLKVGFEYNGVYYHSEIFKDKYYHINKKNSFDEFGISIFMIWEDDWIYKKDIILSMISNKINLNRKLYARKCIISEISSEITREFLNMNHLQGYSNSKYNYGLYYNGELVSVMTLGKRNIKDENSYELIRFCNVLGTSVIGGASKLLAYFIKTIKVDKIISYSKNDIGNGNLYKSIGFNYVKETEPSYFWVVKKKKVNRYNYTKKKLVKLGYDISKTEIKIMYDLGHYRVFDSGNKLWEYNVNI